MSNWFERRWEARQQQDSVALPKSQVLTQEEQQRKDFWLGVQIGVGALAGVALAQLLNSGGEWQRAAAANQLDAYANYVRSYNNWLRQNWGSPNPPPPPVPPTF
ncbi:hypothetical protein AB0876_31320 [Mycobacterium sp. NPDC049093]